MAPGELHKARESLAQAESAFGTDPDSQATRDLAYVANRKAQRAEALADQELNRRKKERAEREYQSTQAEIAQHTKGELSKTREQLHEEQAQLGQKERQLSEAEQKAAAAEEHARELQESLAKLAAVREDERGLVLTLSGSVLFATNSAMLLPEAQTRLNQVAEALLAAKDRALIVEGFTDSRGPSGYNLDLSQRRAEAVRTYLVSRGYPAGKIRAQGYGKDRPIADNTSSEGRANNRRVEIVIEPRRPPTM